MITIYLYLVIVRNGYLVDYKFFSGEGIERGHGRKKN